jgi:endonuclease YncB( thermonuclease family)
VRLIGVDTPETSHPTYGEQPYGQQAKEFTTSRLEGERVALEFDVERVDPYGRLLAYVWLSDGSMFNETLSERGLRSGCHLPSEREIHGSVPPSSERSQGGGQGAVGTP